MQQLLLQAEGQERQDLLGHLTILRRQTALEKGTARHGALRALECGIPYLRFEGVLTVDMQGLDALQGNVPASWVETWLHAVAAAVKSMGGNRSRGFGECKLHFADAPEQVVLPAFMPQFIQEANPCSA